MSRFETLTDPATGNSYQKKNTYKGLGEAASMGAISRIFPNAISAVMGQDLCDAFEKAHNPYYRHFVMKYEGPSSALYRGATMVWWQDPAVADTGPAWFHDIVGLEASGLTFPSKYHFDYAFQSFSPILANAYPTGEGIPPPSVSFLERGDFWQIDCADYGQFPHMSRRAGPYGPVKFWSAPSWRLIGFPLLSTTSCPAAYSFLTTQAPSYGWPARGEEPTVADFQTYDRAAEVMRRYPGWTYDAFAIVLTEVQAFALMRAQAAFGLSLPDIIRNLEKPGYAAVKGFLEAEGYGTVARLQELFFVNGVYQENTPRDAMLELWSHDYRQRFFPEFSNPYNKYLEGRPNPMWIAWQYGMLDHLPDPPSD